MSYRSGMVFVGRGTLDAPAAPPFDFPMCSAQWNYAGFCTFGGKAPPDSPHLLSSVGLGGDVDVGDPVTREQTAQILSHLPDNTVIQAVPHYCLRDEEFNFITDEIAYSYVSLKDENGQGATFRAVYFGG